MSTSPTPPEPSRILLATLTVLTVVSGMVDAVSYLGLGHVFTANMTGNIVLLGFAAAGAKGFSIAASLTSLGSFLLGAAVAGRMTLHVGSRRLWLVFAMAAEGGFTGVAAVVSAFNSGSVSTGWPRYAVIALLAFAMGVRNSTIRRLAVPEVTTTVLTMTLTGLAADSSLAGGHNPRIARRTSAIAAMLVGAFVGAELFLHQGATWPLAIVAAAVLVTGTLFAASRASRQLDA
ncbi:MAG TPA: YoaK family protein [Acidimicrobiales bacterium]|nr:YoaK family protein [Acidimicrobiales bacterium]